MPLQSHPDWKQFKQSSPKMAQSFLELQDTMDSIRRNSLIRHYVLLCVCFVLGVLVLLK